MQKMQEQLFCLGHGPLHDVLARDGLYAVIAGANTGPVTAAYNTSMYKTAYMPLLLYKRCRSKYRPCHSLLPCPSPLEGQLKLC